MKKILLFFAIILLFGCQNTFDLSEEDTQIICPNVFFSSENSVFVDGEIENLELEKVNFKASLNNYKFINQCNSDVKNNNYILMHLFGFGDFFGFFSFFRKNMNYKDR